MRKLVVSGFLLLVMYLKLFLTPVNAISSTDSTHFPRNHRPTPLLIKSSQFGVPGVGGQSETITSTERGSHYQKLVQVPVKYSPNADVRASREPDEFETGAPDSVTGVPTSDGSEYSDTGIFSGGVHATTRRNSQEYWNDKQPYHASPYKSPEYQSASLHHHYMPQPLLQHHPASALPQKKESVVLAKMALTGLVKIILAKIKAIGFLKLLLFLGLKIPIVISKFLLVLKGLKLLLSPLLLGAFIVPIVAFHLMLVPLFIPLLLPLLLFLPIIPVPGRVNQLAPPTRYKRAATTWDFLSSK